MSCFVDGEYDYMRVCLYSSSVPTDGTFTYMCIWGNLLTWFLLLSDGFAWQAAEVMGVIKCIIV